LEKDPNKFPLKRKIEQLYDLEIDENTIEGFKKKRKLTKKERMEVIQSGRDEAQRNSKPEGKSRTNEEKRKGKNYVMMKQKALQKLRYSNSLKKKKFGNHIAKRSSQRINKHRKWHNKSK